MNNNARLEAINGLAKTAGAMPQPMIKMSAAYTAGFRKAAEDAGVDPDQLIKLVKLAWSPTGLLSGTLGAVGNSLVSGFTGNGFGKGWKEGWQWGNDFGDALQDEIYSSNTLKNLGSGVASLGNGFMSGVMNVPGLVTGALGAVGNGVYSGLTGNGFVNGVKGGWRAGQDLADNIGIGDWDLKHAKRRVNRWQDANMHTYMRRNGIDPTQELGLLDRWALNGMGISNAAGTALGEMAAFNAGGKILGGAFKGINKLRNLRKPPSTPGAPGAPAAPVSPAPAPAPTPAPTPTGPYELTINGVPINPATGAPLTTATSTASTAANTANAARTAANAASTASNAANAASTASKTVGLGRRVLNTARNVGTKLKEPARNTLNGTFGALTVNDGVGNRRTTINNLRGLYGKAYSNNAYTPKYTPNTYSMNNLSAQVRF